MGFLNRLGKNKGFTLIELLVVIAIIGILASVVLASLNSARRKGRDARRVADIKQVQLALELYFDAQASYPTVLSDLVTEGTISTIPTDPLGTSIGYSYAYCPGAVPVTNYHLGASLEEQTNPALSSDRDMNSVVTGCTGGTYTSGFDGGSGVAGTESATKCNAAHSGNYCYDITP